MGVNKSNSEEMARGVAVQWELLILHEGEWEATTRGSKAEVDAMLEFIKGCPTNDGQPRRYRLRRWVATLVDEEDF